MNKSEKFTYGKYKGKTMGHVMKNDPSYIHWTNNNVKNLDLTSEEDNKVWRAAVSENKKRSNYKRRLPSGSFPPFI